jgi:DNA-binding MarR family transcriptional regulator
MIPPNAPLSPLRLDDFIPYRLSITSNAVSDAIATAYEAFFALKIPEWRLMTVVADQDGITQQAVCARTRMDKVMVSRGAIALAERGLLARKPNRADKRSHLLVLSPAGWALYAEIVPKARELEARIFAGFDREALDGFVTMLAQIEERALAAQDTPILG